MSRHNKNDKNDLEVFSCRHCGMTVTPPESGGSHRNHCPRCLWSLHVDLKTGDRRCSCRGEMEPISVWVRTSKEWSVIHHCRKCGFIRANRIAGDDNDSVLLKLAVIPWTALPFPAESIGVTTGLRTWEKTYE